MGLGNICRIFYLTDYIQASLHYAFKYCKHPRIHVYGLALRIIPYTCKLSKKYNVELSMDSTKWTRAVTNDFKLQNGAACRSHNRQLYFKEYLKVIESRGINLENKLYKTSKPQTI